MTDDRLGATYLGQGRTRFLVFAPNARLLEARLVSPVKRVVTLEKLERGYYGAVLDGVEPGAAYMLRLDGDRELPDPASRAQPDGVHGPSRVVASSFTWSDAAFRGRPLAEHVLYELHVGAFTTEGTFDAIVPRLAALRDLGITALELMPVAQFPGGRNWGYDGAYPYAVQASYGGRDGLARLVDAAHGTGLAVFLDFVCNHLGPEGNYLREFGPYFTDSHTTPWGAALNLDGPGSDEVRRYFIGCAVEWVRELHVDGLRVDAVHSIVDRSARPFLAELADAVHAEGARRDRVVHVVAESDLNDPRVVRHSDVGGLGFDAQWSDDFHHALHALITGERQGHYQDFGRVEQLAKAYREAYVYTGEPSLARGHRHGAPARDVPPARFVVFAQNHDQVGNRAQGDRLAASASLAELEVAAVAVLLSPFVPLLFMGEEYGEQAPFPYFVDHGETGLLAAVRDGRWAEVGQGAPDPGDAATFLRAKLDRSSARRALEEVHRELLRLRRERPALATSATAHVGLDAVTLEGERALVVRRWGGGDEVALVLAFAGGPATVRAPLPEGRWVALFDSEDVRWSGSGEDVRHVHESRGEVELAVPRPRAREP